ncbi:MAG: hypothetical protein V3R94_00355 [Acidobacteriota bacterium]
MKKGSVGTMHRKLLLGSALTVLLAPFSASVQAQVTDGDHSGLIRLAAFSLSSPLADKKKPLTWKEVNSGAFQKILLITGVGQVQIGTLYATSGAKDFNEFALAFVVSRNLRLDPQLVLRALWDQSLKDILQDFSFPEDQVNRALRIAKDQLDYANKEWQAGRPIQ